MCRNLALLQLAPDHRLKHVSNLMVQDGVLVPSKILYRRLDTIQSVTSSADHSYHSNVVVDEPAEVEPSKR